MRKLKESKSVYLSVMCLSLSMMASTVMATECRGKVEDILIDHRVIVYLSGQGAHKLGDTTDPTIGPKLSLVLSAETRDKDISLKYQDVSYNCSAGWNVTESATFVKMHK